MLEICQEMKTEYLLYAKKKKSSVSDGEKVQGLIMKYMSPHDMCVRFHLHCQHQPFYVRGMDGPENKKKPTAMPV
jgi:hypothetical protein